MSPSHLKGSRDKLTTGEALSSRAATVGRNTRAGGALEDALTDVKFEPSYPTAASHHR
jgi:hypothetical protein